MLSGAGDGCFHLLGSAQARDTCREAMLITRKSNPTVRDVKGNECWLLRADDP